MAASRYLRNGKPALGVFDETEKDGEIEEDDEIDEAAGVDESLREGSVMDDEGALAGKDLVCRTVDYKLTHLEDALRTMDNGTRIKPLQVHESMKKNIVAYIQKKRKQEEEAEEQRTAMKKKKEDAEEKVRNAKKDVEICDEEMKRLNEKLTTMQKQHHEMTTRYKHLFNQLNEREKIQKQKAAEAEARKNAEAAQVAAQVVQAQAQAQAQLNAALEARGLQQQRNSAFAASLANKVGLGSLDPMLLAQLYTNRGMMQFPGLIPNTNPSTQP
ncbi:hypothetical protein L596_018406 [Steinernema carpocapsae]|uniref:Uncharacterized protein n=1 Tax=Steinernema carpocapsae TaxID=34508 RepID=A0A4U5N5K0_STECR|nr:hypothetical protein L596_018406 [Steinernema carpocapsae]